MIILGEFLEANCPDVCVKATVKDQSEWNEFIDSLCRVYGFDNKYCPIVYTLDGKLIGGTHEFKNHIKDRFDRPLQIPKETVKQRTKMIET